MVLAVHFSYVKRLYVFFKIVLCEIVLCEIVCESVAVSWCDMCYSVAGWTGLAGDGGRHSDQYWPDSVLTD